MILWGAPLSTYYRIYCRFQFSSCMSKFSFNLRNNLLLLPHPFKTPPYILLYPFWCRAANRFFTPYNTRWIQGLAKTLFA